MPCASLASWLRLGPNFNNSVISTLCCTYCNTWDTLILRLAADLKATGVHAECLGVGVVSQRHGVVIDACMVGGRDSAFLQQAAHITGGVYLKPDRPGALLEYLLVCRVSFLGFRNPKL